MKPLIIILLSISILLLLISTITLSCQTERFKKIEYTILTDYKGNKYEVSPEFSKEDWENNTKGQQIMTRMFREFDKICRKHGLKYWAIGGTLIGAVRHAGWIPWDGDIDVMMEEKDLDKFHGIALKELSPDFFTVNTRTKPPTGDKHYKDIIGMDKIRYKYGRYSGWDPEMHHHGIQIDLMCLPTDENGRWGQSVGTNTEIYFRDDARDIIFPVRDLEFEGFPIMVPNNYKLYLKEWLKEYPPKILPLKERLSHEGKISFDTPRIWKEEMYPELYNDKSQKSEFYNTTVSTNTCNNLFFVHIPKTGGTTIEDSICTRDQLYSSPEHIEKLFGYKGICESRTHLLLKEQRKLSPNGLKDAITFSVMRDPYERFISEANMRGNSFDKQIEVCEKASPYKNFNNFAHCRPQVDYVGKYGELVDYIFLTENIDTDVKDFLKKYGYDLIGKRRRKADDATKLTVEDLTDKHKKWIEDKYADDIMLYNAIRR